MSYKIITDTCCDFPAEMYKELDLTVVPLTVLYKGVEQKEYTEQWLKDFPATVYRCAERRITKENAAE